MYARNKDKKTFYEDLWEQVNKTDFSIIQLFSVLKLVTNRPVDYTVVCYRPVRYST